MNTAQKSTLNHQKVPVNLNLLLVPYSKILDKKGYLYFSQKILKTQLEQIRQKYFMSPQAWEEYYQKNKNNLCKEADSLLIAEMSLLGKKLPPHFSSILDLGCGFGANSLFLAEQGWQVTAIDISKTAIERLQEQAKQNNLLLTAQQADAVRFSSKEKFDLVLICDLHLASKQRKKMLQNVVQLFELLANHKSLQRKKYLRIEVLVTPIALRMAISLPFSFTSITKELIILKEATRVIKNKITPKPNFSNFKTAKRL